MVTGVIVVRQMKELDKAVGDVVLVWGLDVLIGWIGVNKWVVLGTSL